MATSAVEVNRNAARGCRFVHLEATGDAVDARLAPNGEAYDHRFVASTELVATDGGIIPVRAWNVERFRQRPRFIAVHDIYGESAPLDQVVVGRVVHIGPEKGLPAEMAGPSGEGLVAYVRYMSTPFGQAVRTLYEEGGLDDVSVRWDPSTEQVRAASQDEVRQHGGNLRWVAERVEMLELSAVLLGADSGAQRVRSAVEKMEAPQVRAFSEWVARSAVRSVLGGTSRRVHPPEAGDGERSAADGPALVDAVSQAQASLDAIDTLMTAFAEVKQQLRDSMTNVQNLMMPSSAEPDAEVVPEELEPEEPAPEEAAEEPAEEPAPEEPAPEEAAEDAEGVVASVDEDEEDEEDEEVRYVIGLELMDDVVEFGGLRIARSALKGK